MRRTLITIGVVIAALLGLTAWGCFGLTKHVIVALDKFGDAGAGLAQTSARLNGKHGTIAMADENMGAAKSLIVHADLVARHEQQSLKTWDADGNTLFTNLNGGVTDLRGTIGAATQATNAATKLTKQLTLDAKTANDTLSDTDAEVKEIRKLTPDIARTTAATADTMTEVKGVAVDGRKVADHYEGIIDNPKKSPMWLRMLPPIVRAAIEAALDKWAMSK